MKARLAQLRALAARQYLKAGVLVGSTLAVAGASAQTVTDPFDTAMTTITGKVESYASALVVLSAVAVVFMVGMKYVKKIPRAS